MDSGGRQHPDRWLGCPPFGELVDDTFLPMKTLLSDDIPLPPDFKFTPEIFIKQVREKKLNVGLVINLTFSQRYYEGDDLVDDYNIQYKQIACRGHNEAPQPKERAEFIKACSSFLAKNPGKIIAVHCTHGFNRTGFMICSFLCSERDWAIEAAITEFASRRQPGIYKQDYLNELFELFGDSDDPVIKAPTRPEWDSEDGLLSGITSDEPLRYSSGVVQKEFYEGVHDVHLVRDEALKQRIYGRCCQLCKYNMNGSNVAFPGAQPVSMDLQNVTLIKQKPYRVSWKADGCRYMLYIQDEDNIFFLTRSLHLWRAIGMRFPKIDDLNSHLTDTLVDGEMVTDVINGHSIPRYLIYDVISLNGNYVADQNFDKRCGLIQRVFVETRHNAKRLNLIPPDGEPFKVGAKGFFYVEKTRKTLNLEVPHEKDGLIFQPVEDPYVGGTCPSILKWKPPELNSIDFRLVVREERQNGCLPETYAYLHVSNKTDPMTRIKLDKTNAQYRQYHNKIVEMTLNKEHRWVVMRERTDKLYANSYETAQSVYRSITHPVTEEYLLNLIERPAAAAAPIDRSTNNSHR